ncbi:hypothetical protein D3C72_1911720 [compost metagenome]
MHISFRDNLEGVWKPLPPAGGELVAGKYPEPATPRVSVAPDIVSCFRGVYPNVSKFFEEKNYPHMDFFVYEPVFEGSERVWTPEILTKHQLVWDAHVTNEHAILDRVKMKLIGEVRIYNTNKEPTATTHPFNNPNEPEQSIGPKNIRVVWLSPTQKE